jgi:hypothetical protein
MPGGGDVGVATGVGVWLGVGVVDCPGLAVAVGIALGPRVVVGSGLDVDVGVGVGIAGVAEPVAGDGSLEPVFVAMGVEPPLPTGVADGVDTNGLEGRNGVPLDAGALRSSVVCSGGIASVGDADGRGDWVVAAIVGSSTLV